MVENFDSPTSFRNLQERVRAGGSALDVISRALSEDGDDEDCYPIVESVIDALRKGQQADPKLKTIYDLVVKGISPHGSRSSVARLKQHSKDYVNHEQILCRFIRNNRKPYRTFVIPDSMQQRIVESFHNSQSGAHLGAEKCR